MGTTVLTEIYTMQRQSCRELSAGYRTASALRMAMQRDKVNLATTARFEAQEKVSEGSNCLTTIELCSFHGLTNFS